MRLGVKTFMAAGDSAEQTAVLVTYVKAISDVTLSEVQIVERLTKDNWAPKKPGGGLKDRPQCERCGRPVKITSEDYLREEILCTHCASEAKTSDYGDYNSA